MRLAACAVFLLTLTSSVLANKGNYWWLFPKFDENGTNNKENSSTVEEKQPPINGTQLNLGSNTNIELDLDLNVDTDVEYEEGANESSGDSDMEIPKERSNPDNKKEAGKPNISVADKDDEIVWTVDKDSKESLTDADAAKPEVSDVLEEDNNSDEEDDASVKKSEPEELINLEEKDVAIHVDGDVHPSSKLEQEESDEDGFSGSKEVEEDKQEPTEIDVINKEKDEVVHVNGDDDENAFSGEKEIEDEKPESVGFNERDEAVHENGDAHPSSKLELDENNSKDEKLEDDRDVSEERNIETEDLNVDDSSEETNEELSGTPVAKEIDSNPAGNRESLLNEADGSDEELHWTDEVTKKTEEVVGQDLEAESIEEEESSEETNEGSISDKVISEFLKMVNDKVVEQDQDAETIETTDKELNSDKELSGPPADEEINSNLTDNRESLPNEADRDDEEPYEEPDNVPQKGESSNNNGIEQDVRNEETGKMPTAVPISPIAPDVPKTPDCSFEQRPFNLTIQPVTDSRYNIVHGSDLTLMCHLTPLNNGSEPMPYFRLTWIFQKENCQTGDLSCPKNLTSMAYETQNSNYSLEYSLTKLNHSTDTGLYICQAEIYSCQSEDRNKTHTNLSISLRVYIKPNYAFHIGIISAACVLLLALLAGLVVYARKVQARSKNRYQELLATTDIQYYPSSKVLELPNSVYNPTTTGFTRMSASSFSSKSSFTSNEEEA